MEDRNDGIKQYEAPMITDHGDLVELTAGQYGRQALDQTLPTGFPQGESINFTTNP